MTRPNEPTKEGADLIREMVRADERLQWARQQVEICICDLAKATNAVGKWLVPEDAKPSETFQIPYSDAFLQVHISGVGRDAFNASWRNNKKPRRL